jgi:ABC-type Fe3+/spermidine/putrescine transport system ATPase subunit
MVFQGYGLFPHMTVQQNIAYGLKIAGLSREASETRLAEVMRLVRLEALGGRSISQLSGGQQQRVALARALVMRPPVLLLDEPLAALDLKLRQAMQEELRRIHTEIGGTFVFVTHDQGEAMSLANRVAVMNEGHLLQVGSPEAIYGSPESEFAATFIGEANLFRGERRDAVVHLRSGPRFSAGGPDGQVTVVVRPEAMAIDPPPDAEWVTVRGTVTDRIFLGPTVRLTVRLADELPVLIQASDPTLAAELEAGAKVTVGWPISRHSILQG